MGGWCFRWHTSDFLAFLLWRVTYSDMPHPTPPMCVVHRIGSHPPIPPRTPTPSHPLTDHTQSTPICGWLHLPIMNVLIARWFVRSKLTNRSNDKGCRRFASMIMVSKPSPYPYGMVSPIPSPTNQEVVGNERTTPSTPQINVGHLKQELWYAPSQA